MHLDGEHVVSAAQRRKRQVEGTFVLRGIDRLVGGEGVEINQAGGEADAAHLHAVQPKNRAVVQDRPQLQARHRRQVGRQREMGAEVERGLVRAHRQRRADRLRQAGAFQGENGRTAQPDGIIVARRPPRCAQIGARLVVFPLVGIVDGQQHQRESEGHGRGVWIEGVAIGIFHPADHQIMRGAWL